MVPYLTSLTVEGFRSFVEPSTVSFPEAGLVLLQGVNEDTGGSSGSGKSSVALAIAYALGYCPLSATALASWGTSKALKVELFFMTAEGEVKVKRSNSPVQLWIGGIQVKGGAKAIEERLFKVLGVTPEILSLLTYRGQKKPGLFLSKTDSEKKELLTQLLGLDKYEAAIEAGQLRAKELEQQLTVLNGQRDVVSGMLAEIPPPAAPEEIERQVASISKTIAEKTSLLQQTSQVVLNLTEKLKNVATNSALAFSARIVDLQVQLDGLPTPKMTDEGAEAVKNRRTAEDARVRMEALRQSDLVLRKSDQVLRAKLSSDISSQRRISDARSSLLAQRTKLTTEIDVLNTSTCPTCERTWAEGQAKLEELEEALVQLTGALARCDKADEEMARLVLELTSLPDLHPNPMIAKLQEVREAALAVDAGEGARRQTAYAQAQTAYHKMAGTLQAAVHALKEEQAVASTVAQKPVLQNLEKARALAAKVQEEVGILKHDLLMFQMEAKRAAEAEARRRTLEDKLAAAQKTCDETSNTLNEERDFLGAIGREGFLGSIFDEVLSEISDETNRILGSVANTRSCTLQFRSESLTQKGTVKKSIVPIITINGNETSLDGGPSGGMLSTIELAVDLAVGAVLSRRKGVCPGWLILDESFEGLDTVSKESCTEILSQFAADRLVLVVDHAVEFKSMFSSSIVIEYTDGKSRFAT